MLGVSAKRIVLLAAGAVSAAWCQAGTPSISSLQASFIGADVPSNVTGITSGTGLAGFNLYVNGLFNVQTVTGVTWFNTATRVATVFTQGGAASNTPSFVALSGTTLLVAVPGTLFLTVETNPVPVTITVQQGAVNSNGATFTINPPLQALGPNLPAGTAGLPYSANLSSGGTAPFAVSLRGGALPPGLAVPPPGVTLTGTPTQTGTFSFQPAVTEFWGNAVLGNDTLTVNPALAIATTSLPFGSVGVPYTAGIAVTGGTPPYTWSASGLPPGLGLNPATGVLSGSSLISGTFTVTVFVTDAAQSRVTAQLLLLVSPPPLSVTGSLADGVVGVAYTGTLGARGGTGPYSFTLGGGSLPDGLSLASSGAISGTPKTPGQFTFVGVVTDSAGGTAAGSFRLTVQPAPLNITGGPTGPVAAGVPVSITFGGTGGIPPYRFSPSTVLPPGTALNGGVLTGTPNTVGTFSFRITLGDTTSAVVTKDFALTVTAPALSLGGTLGNGKVGVRYSGQLTAAGGTPPYTYSGSGLPDGLSLSSSGGVSGTPGTAGQFTFTATAADSTGAKASATFPIAIATADLTIVTASLPDGVVGVAYSATLTASGGVKPYAWTATGLPDGVTASAAGAIGGTPVVAGRFTVNVSVKDAAAGSATKSYSVTIAPAPLVITTASAPNGTAGTAYTALFAASGGTAPYTFSASGLPAGLSMSAAGALSGTPTAPGPATIVVTVKDAAGASASRSFAAIIGLPAAPPLNFAGITATGSPLQQPRLQVSLGNSFPLDVVVTLTLTFAPDSGADDPTIQFSGGGRTARITVPAGALDGANDLGVQTGSVAGLITIAAQLQAGGVDVTPSPAPLRTIRIAAAAPVAVAGTLTAVRNGAGFTVTLTGYATDRELTQAVFQFTAAAGSNLQTTTLTVPVDTLFAPYFSGAAAAPFGSQFTYTQPFTVTGGGQAVASVTVTLVNKLGQSSPLTATLN